MPGHVDGYVDIASVAALLADPTRAAILFALGDGQALPAGRLADRVHVSPSTASNHLSKLVERRLLAVEKQGRHRYYRLAEPEIAGVLEALALVAPPAPIRSLRESDAARALRAARLCHNHLAGALGVAVTKAMVECSILAEVEDGYVVTDDGKEWLRILDVDRAWLRKSGQIFAPAHLDWSERQPHLAGVLGSALARRFIELRWVRLVTTSRAVRLTEEGKSGLRELLRVSL